MKANNNEADFKVERQASSGLSAFVERPVPTTGEVDSFEKAIKKKARHQEIDSNLSEIYRDKDGSLINVKTMKIRRRQLPIIRIFKRIFILVILALAAYYLYLYLFSAGGNINNFDLEIEAPEKVVSGEEFSYVINYKNPTKYGLGQINLELKYPDNFIFDSSSLAPETGNYGFKLPDLRPGEAASLTVSGRLINQNDSVNVISARLNYVPTNYSSQFKKEASASTIISGLGFEVSLESAQNVLLGQKNDLTLKFSAIEKNNFGDIFLIFSLPEGAKISLATSTPLSAESGLSVVGGGSTEWIIKGLSASTTALSLSFKYELANKEAGNQISLRLAAKTPDGQAYAFWEKQLAPEIVQSDLNLALTLNGSASDASLNFGQALNYQISYDNKGSNTFSDVAVMAVVDGEFVNWQSLLDENNGEFRSGNSLTWTEEQIPALKEIKPGQSGTISFSLKLKDFQETDLDKDLLVESYAQYSFNKQAVSDGAKSNVISSRINSDLSLDERILYFDEDNRPVGSGPLPPKVGEQTSLRVYWTVKNNLHELSGAKVVLPLPSYIVYSGQASTDVGSLYYDSSAHQVIWDIGRLPVSVYRSDAEFNISLTPTEADRNKILVISPGATVSARDIETRAEISDRSEPKTTKLEDDDIAALNNSGRVE